VIFVTIGSMFPFDRMIRAMDAWTEAEGRGEEVFAQIGAGDYEPRHMTWVRKLDRRTYAETIRRSRLVVAHAGVGSIVTAGELRRPIVVLPRRAHLGEHTSDHQVETAGWLREKAWIQVADDEGGLSRCIAAAAAAAARDGRLSATAAPDFIDRLRRFIAG
jgi:UDP-N-acetylglucosamine transferase subunit ALG13